MRAVSQADDGRIEKKQVSEESILPLLFFYLPSGKPRRGEEKEGVSRTCFDFFPAFRIRLPVNLSANDGIMPAQQPVCGPAPG